MKATSVRLDDETLGRAGRIGRVSGTRELVVEGASFIVIYRQTGSDQLQVIRVLHDAQQWPSANWHGGGPCRQLTCLGWNWSVYWNTVYPGIGRSENQLIQVVTIDIEQPDLADFQSSQFSLDSCPITHHNPYQLLGFQGALGRGRHLG